MEGTNHHYQILGLKPGASQEEIAQAHKILTKTCYLQQSSEDKSVREIAREKLIDIEEAYVKLTTPVHTALGQGSSSSASKLEVRSEPPGAKVYIDGREIGETPLILSEINSGQYTIQVVKEGFNPSDGKVEIRPGERKGLNAHLKQKEPCVGKVGLRVMGPSGVGGWLLLLVVGLLVLGPLFGVIGISRGFVTEERHYPTATHLQEWANFKTGISWTFLMAAALSLYGGWGLARGKDWSVVKRAKFVLWVSWPVAALFMCVIVPIATLGKCCAADSPIWGGLIASIISARIWTTYLSKSKRVHNTYGSPKRRRY